MQKMSPKEYYKGAFRDIVQEINQNKKSIRTIIICPTCNAKNLSFNKFCYKCMKKLPL